MKLNNILNQEIIDNSKIIEDIVYEIVTKYTKPLDDIMKICRNIFNSGTPITNEELEDLLLQLPCNLYFVGEGQEITGIKEDISKMTKMEVYNEARKKAIGTIADKNTEAEIESLNEALNQIIYQRSYKMLKNKIEMGYEMINSLKRINDKRNMEYQIGRGIKR